MGANENQSTGDDPSHVSLSSLQRDEKVDY